MKIDLTELLAKAGSEADFEKTENVSYPEDDLALTKPVKIKLHLVNTGDMVLLKGEIDAEAELECSRCLKKFKFPLFVKIKEDFTRNLLSPSFKKGREIELHEEDFVSPIEKDNSIDISDLVRQALLLSLPIKPLCQDSCKG